MSSAAGTSTLFSHLLESRIVVFDGAMGTMLYSKGISFDQCFDALNLTRPGLVRDIHDAYMAAGSQILETNTFGANRFRLAEPDHVKDVNRAGVRLAQRGGRRQSPGSRVHWSPGQTPLTPPSRSRSIIRRFRGKPECPLLGESRRSISIKSDAVCEIGCRLSHRIRRLFRPFRLFLVLASSPTLTRKLYHLLLDRVFLILQITLNFLRCFANIPFIHDVVPIKNGPGLMS